MSNRTVRDVDPALSVNEILRRWPAAIPALNAAGIDTCCGGAASLEAAAHDAGVALDPLVAAIERVVVGDACGPACECRGAR